MTIYNGGSHNDDDEPWLWDGVSAQIDFISKDNQIFIEFTSDDSLGSESGFSALMFFGISVKV